MTRAAFAALAFSVVGWVCAAVTAAHERARSDRMADVVEQSFSREDRYRRLLRRAYAEREVVLTSTGRDRRSRDAYDVLRGRSFVSDSAGAPSAAWRSW